MATSAAMVQLKVVKGGGAGGTAKMSCAQVRQRLASSAGSTNAWCWNVQDGQTHFTEHRFLTDRMAAFQAADGGGQKTLAQHLDAYEKACEDCLHDGKRAPNLKNPERPKMAARAAECLREEQEAAFAAKDCKVDQQTKLREQSLPLRKCQSPMRRP